MDTIKMRSMGYTCALACVLVAHCTAGLAQYASPAPAPSIAPSAPPATPQPAAASSVIIYGNIDEYLGYIRSDSGTHIVGLNDGAILRSRLGVRGAEPLGPGYDVKFNLELGHNADTGTQADASRIFDRQAWVGVSSPAGEFRAGRQNTEIFMIGGAIDYTERTTFGSIINTFGVPSRYDNDLSWKSTRWSGLQLVLHYALPENGGAARGNNAYANYQYGQGTLYLAAVRSNNSTGNATGNNATSIVSNVGNPNNFFPGTDLNAGRYHNIWQLSADYRLNPQCKVGALYGVMHDTTDGDAGARGGNIGAYYDLSKRTTLYSFASYMKNQRNAGFRFLGSAAPSANLAGADINGRTLTGLQLGILHRF